MGNTFDGGYENEKPVHNVCVSDFYIGKYEVTQEQWKAIMGNNPSHFSSSDTTNPVDSVSWDDIQNFIRKLNSRTGKSYRLPTEAEWEYAARSGGKKEKYSGTNSDSDLENHVWYNSNSGAKSSPVGQKKPNSIGLYDMSGNVCEWVSDWYNKMYYSSSPRDNPQGPSTGSTRVRRGGNWGYSPRNVRVSSRKDSDSSTTYSYIGFRVASSHK